MKDIALEILDLGRIAMKQREIRFFGAFRSRGIQRWDIVIAVPGLPPDQPEVYRFIANLLATHAPTLAQRALDRVVVLSETDSRIADTERLLPPGKKRLRNFQFGAVEVAEAYILRSRIGRSVQAGAAH